MEDFFSLLGTYMLYGQKKKNNKKDNKEIEPYAVCSILQYLSAAHTLFMESSTFSKGALTPAVCLKVWGDWCDGTDGKPPKTSQSHLVRHFPYLRYKSLHNEYYITNEKGDLLEEADPDNALYADELGAHCK